MTASPSAEVSNVDRLYAEVKTMAAGFEIRPGERINESVLARSLGASRTPLREALNRLTAEGYLTFQQGKGFFCRSLTPQEIFDLYEARLALELATVRLACERAKDEEIAALRQFLMETGPDEGGRSIAALVELDEIFHQRIAALSGNRELAGMLENIGGRIRFVRWLDMERRRRETQGEHLEIVQALAHRDPDAAVTVMRKHVERRREAITAAVREGYSRLYVPTDEPGEGA